MGGLQRETGEHSPKTLIYPHLFPSLFPRLGVAVNIALCTPLQRK